MQSEEIGLSPNAGGTNRNIYAFAWTFPQRSGAAFDAAKGFKTELQCRAVGEVIVAYLDPATRAVTNYKRVDIDEEALVSVVGALDFVPTYGRPTLLATYLATYGGSEWVGQIHWNEIITADPLTVLRRVPDTYAKTDADGVETAGALLTDGASKNDPYGLTVAPGASAQMSVLNLTNPAAPARHAFLLAGPSGLASGWTLLSQL